jgi:hypothetical protein
MRERNRVNKHLGGQSGLQYLQKDIAEHNLRTGGRPAQKPGQESNLRIPTVEGHDHYYGHQKTRLPKCAPAEKDKGIA